MRNHTNTFAKSAESVVNGNEKTTNFGKLFCKTKPMTGPWPEILSTKP
jgi:hypothetical protein